MKLLVKADDFGFTEAISHGIIKSHTHGLVQSTGIMINMPAAKHALKLIQDYPTLCLGLHVNLVIGKPVCPVEKIPSLVQSNGHFKTSVYYRDLIAQGIEPIEDIEQLKLEIEAQLQRFFRLTKKMPEYFEGHAVHSHNIDFALSEVAKKYNLVHIGRVPKWNNRIKETPIRSNSIYEFYKKDLEPQLFFTDEHSNILGKELAMVVLHPGYLDQSIYEMSSFTKVRIQDLHALTHPQTWEWIENNNIELVSHRYITESI